MQAQYTHGAAQPARAVGCCRLRREARPSALARAASHVGPSASHGCRSTACQHLALQACTEHCTGWWLCREQHSLSQNAPLQRVADVHFAIERRARFLVYRLGTRTGERAALDRRQDAPFLRVPEVQLAANRRAREHAIELQASASQCARGSGARRTSMEARTFPSCASQKCSSPLSVAHASWRPVGWKAMARTSCECSSVSAAARAPE
jgi:hypothetical protein